MPTFKHPCPYCDKFIDRAVAACPYCGVVEPFGPKRCLNCRKIVEDPAWVVCPSCGASLIVVAPAADGTGSGGGAATPGAAQPGAAQPGAAQAAPQPPPAQAVPSAPPAPAPQAPPPAAAPAAPAPAAGKCAGCGSPLPAGARFCTVCGTVAG